MTSSTVVLDVGKTNIKLCRVDERGAIVEQRSRPNEVRTGAPYPHFDLDAIFSWLVDTLGSFSDRGSIGTIATTTHGASAVLLSDEELALPMLDYEYDAIEELSSEYDAKARD